MAESLIVLPHDTPMLYRPEHVMVRTVTTIPSRKTKDEILNYMARLNKHLNTEKWRITNSRPKGTGLLLHMRMDKQSFDIIERQNGKINWILGPIIINKETHNPKRGSFSSAPSTVAAISNSDLGEHHLTPPSSEVVDGTPKAPGLTSYGGSRANKWAKQANRK